MIFGQAGVGFGAHWRSFRDAHAFSGCMSPRSPWPRVGVPCLALLVIGGLTAFWLRGPAPAPSEAPASASAPIPSATPTTPLTAARLPSAADGIVSRPLAVATESASHAWTREDAKDPAVIDRLAHGPEEFLRMVEENDRIKRRQLVYRKEPVALLLEQARASGVPLTRFTLPVLDGAEVEVEVLETQIDGHRGAVIGRIVGQPDSLACVGFSGSCESFNILAPSSGLFIAADAREPGEVILKEIDPAVYSPMACGGPLTAQN